MQNLTHHYTHSSMTCSLLLLWLSRRTSTHGIIGECLFQTLISSMLRVFSSFFTKIRWYGAIQDVNRYAICPFYLAQNCDMIGKCPPREIDDGIEVLVEHYSMC
ncbi:hypothetical protein E2542_SST12077 [Spatholobus suberectus]|nr:hypothetical protein E2542_SST12077 [Spatholobus suberectus]